MKVIFTRGISASGKTTWSEQFVKENPEFVNINRDDIRWSLFTDNIPDWGKYKFSKGNEKLVSDKQIELIIDAVKNGKSIIISNTNLKDNYITSIMSLPYLSHYSHEVKWFDIDLLEALKRDALRINGVGYDVITKQYQSYMELKYSPDYHSHSSGKVDAFICDIDGTIANMKGIRTPFEWMKVGNDKPIITSISMVQGLLNTGFYPIFVSGRDGICYDATYNWICKQFGNIDFKLFMRPVGSFEKDTKIKKDIFIQHVEGEYNIHVVLDDRPTVSRMFRYELGLNVVQIGNPYIEF
jgi:predicted kinase